MAGARVDEQLLRHITDRIVQHFHPHRIVLFGSHARGDARPDSDVDLLVVMDSDKSFHQRGYEVGMLFADRDWPMDLIVLTPDEMRREREFLGGVVRTAEREGKILYDAT